MEEDLDDILAHFGIKGMKWGVRRKRGPDGRVIKSATKTVDSEDSARAKEAVSKAKKTGLSSLSNKELETLNKRLNLEQQYSNLTSKPVEVSKGKKFAKELAVHTGKKQASNLTNKAAEAALAAAGAAILAKARRGK